MTKKWQLLNKIQRLIIALIIVIDHHGRNTTVSR